MKPPTIEERITTIRKHITYAIQWKGERLGILETRRHYSGYLKGLKNIKEFRKALVTANSFDEIDSILEKLYESFLLLG